MEQIANAFRRDFANWSLELPAAALQTRQAGFIQAQGWLIQYAFGKNRLGEYLDYYAVHRMTDDSHVRLYANGRRQHLAALVSMFWTSEDPEEAKRHEASLCRRNRRIARALVRKGFDKFTMNMSLLAGLEANER
jgi:hypothetical protein